MRKLDTGALLTGLLLSDWLTTTGLPQSTSLPTYRSLLSYLLPLPTLTTFNLFLCLVARGLWLSFGS